MPFTPVEFGGLTAKAYVTQTSMNARPRVAWSLTAREILPAS
jgi:hypothetical protein